MIDKLKKFLDEIAHETERIEKVEGMWCPVITPDCEVIVTYEPTKRAIRAKELLEALDKDRDNG